jgi:hypothetical protein
LLAKLEDTIGAGNPQGFDELKTAAIRRAVEEMLDKHAENGLPIMVIDDGGYVSKVVRAHFKDDESKFRFVEWTTRGVRQFETIADPAYALVSAAECQPKSYFEPPFIAKAAVEHLLVGAGTRFSSLKDLEVATIGHGSIGRAAALALAGEGAAVQVSDLDAKHRARAAEDGLAQTADVKQAVAGKKLVVGATGANSSPPPLFEASAPGTVWASLSSVDIETRDDKDPRNNGTWGTNLVRANLKAELDPTAPGGVKVELEAREILNGGYPLNPSRRVRVMPLEEEEVILLVLNEAIAQATQEKGTGKKQVARREDRIDRLYRQYHRSNCLRDAFGSLRRGAVQVRPVGHLFRRSCWRRGHSVWVAPGALCAPATSREDARGALRARLAPHHDIPPLHRQADELIAIRPRPTSRSPVHIHIPRSDCCPPFPVPCLPLRPSNRNREPGTGSWVRESDRGM